MISPKILITGADGLLGPYLCKEARSYGEVISSSRSGGDVSCDLGNRNAARELIEYVCPDWLVHAAAMTDVDQCERNPATAEHANRDVVANVVSSLPSTVNLVLLSTDQVYPNVIGPHREADASPINVYGKTKLAGEFEALRRRRSLILRTNFFGPSKTDCRSSLDDFILNSLRHRQPIILFQDVLFSPLHMSTVAKTLFEALKLDLTGVYNLGCRNGATKADFALRIAKHLGLDSSCARLGLSNEKPGRCLRSQDLRMDVSRIETALGRTLPILQEEIELL